MARETRYVAIGAGLALVAGSWFAGKAAARAPVPSGSEGRPSSMLLAAAGSQADALAEGVTVQGRGRVSGKPDVMRVEIGVEVHRANVQEALDRANTLAGKLTSALRSQGVAERDIQTTNLSISAEYSYPQNSAPVLKGYVVSNHVMAKVRNLSKAGATVQVAATAAGDEVRLGGVSFDLEDNADLLKAARTAAWTDAHDKAQQYATLAGRQLGAVVSISEVVSSPPPVTYDYAKAAPMGAAPSVPISPGEQEVGVSVTAVFALR